MYHPNPGRKPFLLRVLTANAAMAAVLLALIIGASGATYAAALLLAGIRPRQLMTAGQ